jgi:hypothetical protein
VHAAKRREIWRKTVTRPVIDLYEDDRYSSVRFAERASIGFAQAQSA